MRIQRQAAADPFRSSQPTWPVCCCRLCFLLAFRSSPPWIWDHRLSDFLKLCRHKPATPCFLIHDPNLILILIAIRIKWSRTFARRRIDDLYTYFCCMPVPRDYAGRPIKPTRHNPPQTAREAYQVGEGSEVF